MALSQTTLIRPMTNWATAAASRSETEMMLTTWGMEVLTPYEEYMGIVPLLTRGTIESGTTKRFPKTWKIGSEVHEAGAELLGMEFETGYEEISLDPRPLVTHFAVDDIDMLLAQYESRSKVTRQMGIELAKNADKRAFSLLCQAAVVADDTDDSFPGRLSYLGVSAGAFAQANIGDVIATWSEANVAASVNNLLLGLDQIGLAMDNQYVPQEGRRVILHPTLFQACRKYGLPSSAVLMTSSSYTYAGTQNLNPFGAPPTTSYVPYTGTLQYSYWTISQSAIAPWNTNVNTGPAKWQVDASNVYGVAFHPDACAWVDKLGVVTEIDRDVRRQQDFVVSKVMHGGGTLRPYCACLIKDS